MNMNSTCNRSSDVTCEPELINIDALQYQCDVKFAGITIITRINHTRYLYILETVKPEENGKVSRID